MSKFNALGTLLLAFVSAAYANQAPANYDVVVYGGTSGGVVAAIQAANMGKSAVLIEPSDHVGGLTSGGLGATDIGNKAAIGGIARSFYQKVKEHYADATAWQFEKPEDYKNPRHSTGDDAMWTFEPHVAESILRAMLDDAGVTLITGERLDRTQGVVKVGTTIDSITMESGIIYQGQCYIDATYEGDLLAAAGVSYHVGREANNVYAETLNGVQTQLAIYHQLVPGVDPYVVAGDPSSGLLPGVHDGPVGEDGSGDARVQAYNFRMCLTDAPENRKPFEKPAGYDPLRYELLFRNFEAGEIRAPWSPTLMPNRKTDVNNNFGFSTDNIGMNYGWAEGSYEDRDRIFADHLLYQRGLMWTLANHPRVPQTIRDTVSKWGNCKDEFPENDGWSHQLYVREGRRMVSDYVMTQHNCEGTITADQSVGLAAYTMDSHHVQRYVTEEGFAQNEGDVQVGGFPPYPIAYQSICPKRTECTNLLVPVCLSSSHIAYGSIRMEPVFMVLGQSAATAASLAIDNKVAVQDVDYAALRAQLEQDKQVLAWTGPGTYKTFRIDPKSLEGIVIDDTAAELSPGWSASTSVPRFVGTQYRHDTNENKGKLSATYRIKDLAPGKYEVRVSYAPHANRATNVPVTVYHADGNTRRLVNERETPQFDDAFVSLGTFRFDTEARIVLSNADTDGHVTADAVQLIPEKKE